MGLQGTIDLTQSSVLSAAPPSPARQDQRGARPLRCSPKTSTGEEINWWRAKTSHEKDGRGECKKIASASCAPRCRGLVTHPAEAARGLDVEGQVQPLRNLGARWKWCR